MMLTNENLHLRMDGIQAVLALSKLHNCNDTLKEIAIDQLSKYVTIGRPNCFAMGFIAFYMIFDKSALQDYKQSPSENALIDFYDEFHPETAPMLHAVKEIVHDGYLMKYLKLIHIE